LAHNDFSLVGGSEGMMFLEIQTHLIAGEKADKVFINLKKQAISVSINTFEVYTFDLMGRLITAVRDGHTFRRSLNNQIMEKWSVFLNGQKKRVRLWLNLKKKRAFLESIQQMFWSIFCLLQQNEFDILATDEDDVEKIKQRVLTAFKKILFFDFHQLEKDAKNFSSIYRRVGILPPDMYLSVLLQATEGCSYNRCSYCTFYKGQPFRVKSQSEFRKHILAVKDYFGESIRLRKYLFLGEANALVISQPRLISFFDEVNKQFIFSETDFGSDNESMLPSVRGIYSFLSLFDTRQKSVNDFAELGARNLRRVYIGMETGCDELLKFLNKPVCVEDAVRFVESIKKGGVKVGIIILLGAGGNRYYQAHVNDTVTAIKEMNLEHEDIVFFSPIIQFPGTAYSHKILAEHIRPLKDHEIDMQKQEILKGCGFPRDVNSPKVALYDINEFIY
jgi:hypothetical protein